MKEQNQPITSEPKKANCPHCSFVFDKIPSRKQKCLSCGKEFFVRTDYITKNKLLLTQEEAIIYDVEKQKYYTDLVIDESLINGLKMDRDVDKDMVDQLVKEIRTELTARFGRPASLSDVSWGVANHMIIDAGKKQDFGLMSSIYFQMALYLHRCGKDGNYIREIEHEIKLNEYKKSNVISKVRILANGCDNCNSLNNKIFSIDEAIEKKILPCKQCTFKLNTEAKTGWCRCCYLPVVE
jgi:hypothetical protein